MTTSTTSQVTLRRSSDRGHTQLGWLDSRHSFSFGEYYDPRHVAFRSLRVINDDRVAPGMGFGTHPHRDMEILTYVVSGQLQHRDSMGNGRIIQTGELQAMSAGRGITHSEFNPSQTEPAHFLQIWIQPRAHGLDPTYAERKPVATYGALTLLASQDGDAGSVVINQDASLYIGKLASGESITHQTDPAYGLWVHLISGSLRSFDHTLLPGDSMSVEDASALTLTAEEPATFLLFSLA